MKRHQKVLSAPIRTVPIGEVPTGLRSRLLVVVNEWPDGSARVSLSYFIETHAGRWVPNGRRLSIPFDAAGELAAVLADPRPTRSSLVADTSFRVEADRKRAERREAVEARIVTLLAHAPRGLSGAGIERERLGPRDAVREALQAAVAKGSVRKGRRYRSGGGFEYRLV